MVLYVRVMIYVISNQVSGHVYARFPFVCSIRDEGPAPQVQNLSRAIALFMKQVPHQSCELDMPTSHHPHMHGLWTHEGGGNRPECPHVFSTQTCFVGPLGLGRSPTFKGGNPDVTHVPLC